jgi:predicted membrane metal-binding protein
MRQIARKLWIGTSAFGACTATSLSCPHLAMIVGIALTASAVAVLVTALYASQELSARAFRLLRWISAAPSPTAATTNTSCPCGRCVRRGRSGSAPQKLRCRSSR